MLTSALCGGPGDQTFFQLHPNSVPVLDPLKIAGSVLTTSPVSGICEVNYRVDFKSMLYILLGGQALEATTLGVTFWMSHLPAARRGTSTWAF